MFHLVPVQVQVRWIMAVEPVDDGASQLRCTVELTLSPVLRILAATIATSFFVRSHVRNESHGFARDIERKHVSRQVKAAPQEAQMWPRRALGALRKSESTRCSVSRSRM